MAAKIRKGDKVVVLTGRDKGKTGEVLEVRPDDSRALVQGVNIGQAPPEADARRPGRRHHHQGNADPHVQYRACRSQGRQADPRRIQDPDKGDASAVRFAKRSGDVIDG